MSGRSNSALAVSCLGLVIFAAITAPHAQQNLRRIALKNGESTELRDYYYIQNCQSILIGTPVLDVLEGADELAVTLKEGPILPRAQNCAKQVPGGVVVLTAKDVTERKEAKLTIRLKFKTKIGERQGSDSYLVSLFP
jgi:hypothetical protein